jgi:phosphatidylglycerol:prolipoprotein diacylglycerol transferase
MGGTNKAKKEGIDEDDFLTLFMVTAVCSIIGARIYYVLFNLPYYLHNPGEIIAIWHGGLAIHGGLIAGTLTMVLMSRKYRMDFWHVTDILAPFMILGQAIGRWGNYFNAEAYGLPVESQTWGLFIPVARRVPEFANYTLFHPTFLYESLLNFVGFGILLFIILKFGKKYQGLTFFAYLCIYSLIRFFVEPIRVDSALNLAGNVPIAAVISVILLVIGLVGVASIVYQTAKANK